MAVRGDAPAGRHFAAAADWTKDQRTRFIASCVEGCQSTPNLSDSGKAACPKACTCLADQGETMMTPADYDDAKQAFGK